ncbi:MAG TPA: EAL domain-containing protein [Acidimicrobiales bacterium]|nr:EAL domain-containing protein [Acidimicrobiales bacterium]
MSTDDNTSLEKTMEETRLVVETLVEVVAGTEIVAIVTGIGEPIPGFTMEPLVSEGAQKVYESICEHIQAELLAGHATNSYSTQIRGVEWGVLVDPIRVKGGVDAGALVVSRQGRTWSRRERSLVKAFGSLLSQVATLATRESNLLLQRRLDELVASVAEHLMSGTSANRGEVLQWTVRQLAEFIEADVAFIRRNDHQRGLSVLEAEWPKRENIPDPDPLGEVPFDSDPVFMAMKDLRRPFMPGVDETPEDYLARVESGSGVSLVAGGAVPLLMGDTTWGVLGFLHFGLHKWIPEEVNAMQAVASMLAQMQGRIEAEERIIYNANHDELTGLANRRALVAELKSRLEARRDTAVMVIDLDRFKVMNDYLGHQNGDRLLITMADRLRTSVRANDFVARLGGDEFVFLVDKAKSEMEVLASAYRMLDVIAEPVEIGGQRMNHTASIGIALAPRGSKNGLDLLGRADVAMYAAKARGRNQAVIFDEELSDSVDERSHTELLLREAVESDGLRLHFQPEVDLRTGKLLAVESLVRWQHPTRGLLSAGQFIKIAEDTGLVTMIGRWVFAEACRQLSEWRRDYPTLDFIVRVNMSPADFKMDDLVDFVAETLRKNNVPGERLCVEITEYTVMDDPIKTAEVLRGFQELGVEIALDDFGTGFGSMTELKHLPVDLLKLDMSFVRGINSDPYDAAIVESIIRLGAALNLEIIAEGIESSMVVDKLLELGCHRGQGYLISVPMAPRDLAGLLETGSASEAVLRTGDVTRQYADAS